jgi:large subunit ribosomal protein L10
MNKAEKNAEIETLLGYFKGAAIAICTHYQGLTVGQVSTLRSDLRKAGAKARVSKNTFIRLAAKRSAGDNSAIDPFVEKVDGPNLVVFCDDPVAPAKVLTKFAKDNEKFKVKGAWFEGKYIDATGVDTLSKMPGKAELLATLLRLINTPATQLVRVISAPGTQTVRVLDAVRTKLEGAKA